MRERAAALLCALAEDHPDQARGFEKSIKITKDRVAARIRGVEGQVAALKKSAFFRWASRYFSSNVPVPRASASRTHPSTA